MGLHQPQQKEPHQQQRKHQQVNHPVLQGAANQLGWVNVNVTANVLHLATAALTTPQLARFQTPTLVQENAEQSLTEAKTANAMLDVRSSRTVVLITPKHARLQQNHQSSRPPNL